MIWISIGENCLADELLRRFVKKSFSTPFSSGRSNIDYVNCLESNNYKGLLNSELLFSVDYLNKSVVRSKRYIECDDIFHHTCSNGFEFTHHNPIESHKDYESIQRKIERMLALRGSDNDIMMLYHHRTSRKSNLEVLVKKLQMLSDLYSVNGKTCRIACFYQEIVTENECRGVDVSLHSDSITSFQFRTRNLWEGSDNNVFWAKCDDDLIGLMFNVLDSLN